MDTDLGWGLVHAPEFNLELAKHGFFRAAFSTIEEAKLVGVGADWEFQKLMGVIGSVTVDRLIKTSPVERESQLNN